jgi:hypothetical protein
MHIEVIYKLEKISSICGTLGSQVTVYGVCYVLKITNGQPVLLLSVFCFHKNGYYFCIINDNYIGDLVIGCRLLDCVIPLCE